VGGCWVVVTPVTLPVHGGCARRAGAARLSNTCSIQGWGTMVAPLARRLRRMLGDDAVVTGDGIVVLPESAEQVRFAVRECAYADTPFVARPTLAGVTGAAVTAPGGGAAVAASSSAAAAVTAPAGGGVVIVTSRMRRVLDVDVANQRAIV